MGTPELAGAGLKTLLASDFFDIKAVITKTDTQAGRNLKIQKPAVKLELEKYFLENNLSDEIKVFQPQKIKEIEKEIKELQPDLIVVIAYGKILPPEILNIPKYGCINVHASLLPKYRGASCVYAPILNGDEASGITIMKMDEGMDTGPIIKKIEVKLDPQETGPSLLEKIIKLTQENLVAVLLDYINGKIEPQAQDENQASYVKLIKKEDGHLSFSHDSAQVIEKKIRAYDVWPQTWAWIEKDDLPKRKLLFKILKSEQKFIPAENYQAGEIFLDNGVLAIKARDWAIVPTMVQLEGKKPLPIKDFLQGNNWVIGKILE